MLRESAGAKLTAQSTSSFSAEGGAVSKTAYMAEGA
jgi:hypothetical protein